MCYSSTLLRLALLASSALAASSEDWKSRSIYQIMTDRFAVDDGSTTEPCDAGVGTYCGGTFNGIRKRLDYIQGMGFDAIWISPVTKQVEGDQPDQAGYHGYWQQDLYAIEPHFGTSDDLKALSQELHDRDMYLMVDVVVNHNGWKGSADSIDYSVFNPFNDQSFYHSNCEINFDDINNTTNMEECWLSSAQVVPLPDLRTEDEAVAKGYQTWISELVSNYSIDGLRLDTVMEVGKDFWPDFIAAAGIYMVGEVAFGDPGTVCSYQNYLPGLLDYGSFFKLTDAFKSTSGNISDLANSVASVQSECSDLSLLGSFSENHDQPRFAYLNPDIVAAENLIAYTMLNDGIPIIYEGQEQHHAATGSSNGNDPYNREAVWLSNYNTDASLYKLVAKLNKVRTTAIRGHTATGYLEYQSEVVHVDDSTIATRKGKLVAVLSNLGSEGDSYTLDVPAKYRPNRKLTEVLSCEELTADGEGHIAVPIEGGKPRVYYPTALLGGSGLCGH